MVVALAPDKGLIDAVNAICIFMKAIIAEFMFYINVDEQRAHHAHRKPQKIDCRKKLLPLKIAEEKDDVVLYHEVSIMVDSLAKDVPQNTLPLLTLFESF